MALGRESIHLPIIAMQFIVIVGAWNIVWQMVGCCSVLFISPTHLPILFGESLLSTVSFCVVHSSFSILGDLFSSAIPYSINFICFSQYDYVSSLLLSSALKSGDSCKPSSSWGSQLIFRLLFHSYPAKNYIDFTSRKVVSDFDFYHCWIQKNLLIYVPIPSTDFLS